MKSTSIPSSEPRNQGFRMEDDKVLQLKKLSRFKGKNFTEIMLALVADALQGKAPEADSGVPARLATAGVLDVIPDIFTHSFNSVLSDSDIVVIVTENLLRFVVAHRHLSYLRFRFEQGQRTSIYVVGTLSGEGGVKLSPDNAHAVDKLLTAIAQGETLTRYLAKRGSAELLAENDTGLEIVPFVPLSSSTPSFAILDDKQMIFTMPIINPVVIEPMERRALVVNAGENSQETLWIQMMTLDDGLPNYRNLVAEKLVDGGYLARVPVAGEQ
ncbi:MAG: hypothetical protein E5W65_10245 [Mesorhizobium sp.]|uniref:hypothetical protein n=1 Tax=Mesorhizobium sp. TaxID=1871066 RepID=UPI00121FF5C9|nr:hypothetical protein [Mesorhizobium sp.]TIT36140.1 MAG: hypothetical protein E5W65_10245 [Mesorhizobium sp.]